MSKVNLPVKCPRLIAEEEEEMIRLREEQERIMEDKQARRRYARGKYRMLTTGAGAYKDGPGI